MRRFRRMEKAWRKKPAPNHPEKRGGCVSQKLGVEPPVDERLGVPSGHREHSLALQCQDRAAQHENESHKGRLGSFRPIQLSFRGLAAKLSGNPGTEVPGYSRRVPTGRKAHEPLLSHREPELGVEIFWRGIAVPGETRRLSRRIAESGKEGGFTLLEVLVALAILAIGATLTMSLISGSLRNIRKVQLRAQTIQHAESVLEVALLDETITQPTTLHGDFEDGTRWVVQISEMVLPDTSSLAPSPQLGIQARFEMPIKAFSYALEIMSPESTAPDLRLQTVKLVNVQQRLQPAQLPSPARMPR